MGKSSLRYHYFDYINGDMKLDITVNEMEKLIGIPAKYVNTYASRNINFKNCIIYLAEDNPNISTMLQNTKLPSKLKKSAIESELLDLKRDMEEIHFRDFGSNKEIVYLDDVGNIKVSFSNYADAAEWLSIPIGTVKSRLYRTLKMLRKPVICRREDYHKVIALHY